MKLLISIHHSIILVVVTILILLSIFSAPILVFLSFTPSFQSPVCLIICLCPHLHNLYTFPPILYCRKICAVLCLVTSVVSSSLQPYKLQPARLLCPWDSPGKSTGVGCHSLLQRILHTQGWNLGFLHCSHSLPSEPPEKPGGELGL